MAKPPRGNIYSRIKREQGIRKGHRNLLKAIFGQGK